MPSRRQQGRTCAGATHRDPRRAHRTCAEILLRHYRVQLHGSDTARNIAIHRVAKENKGSESVIRAVIYLSVLRAFLSNRPK